MKVSAETPSALYLSVIGSIHELVQMKPTYTIVSSGGGGGGGERA